MKIPNNLAEYRRKLNISRNELAGRTNLSPTYLYYLEKGIKEPSWHTADKIAAALGVPLEEIFPQFASRKSPLPTKVAQR